MAVLQTVYTAWKINGQVMTLTLQNGLTIVGQLTDDGNGEDAITVTTKAGVRHIIQKTAVCVIDDPAQAQSINPPGQGTNQMRLL